MCVVVDTPENTQMEVWVAVEVTYNYNEFDDEDTHDTKVVGVFSTQELAEETRDKMGKDWGILPFEVDDLVVTQLVSKYTATIDIVTRELKVDRTELWANPNKDLFSAACDRYKVTVTDRDVEKAIKACRLLHKMHLERTEHGVIQNHARYIKELMHDFQLALQSL